MVAPRLLYRQSEAAVRGAWAASIGLASEDEIRERAHCSQAIAFRVAILRRAGGLRPLKLWLDGALTLRQIERLITASPFDEDAQTREARHMSATARAMLARAAASG